MPAKRSVWRSPRHAAIHFLCPCLGDFEACNINHCVSARGTGTVHGLKRWVFGSCLIPLFISQIFCWSLFGARQIPSIKGYTDPSWNSNSPVTSPLPRFYSQNVPLKGHPSKHKTAQTLTMTDSLYTQSGPSQMDAATSTCSDPEYDHVPGPSDPMSRTLSPAAATNTTDSAETMGMIKKSHKLLAPKLSMEEYILSLQAEIALWHAEQGIESNDHKSEAGDIGRRAQLVRRRPPRTRK